MSKIKIDGIDNPSKDIFLYLKTSNNPEGVYKLEYILRSFDEDVKQENKELHESFSKWCQERGQFP